jgi:DNA-binding response OmpR family regulator
MSKKIVIVESDTAFSQRLHEELAKNGFEVVPTADGKGAYDLTRK